MNIYSRLLIFVSAVWIAFEIALVIRDRLQGKGKTGKDQGTRYINFIAIFVAMTASGILNGNSRFRFPGGRTLAVYLARICHFGVRRSFCGSGQSPSWAAHSAPRLKYPITSR